MNNRDNIFNLHGLKEHSAGHSLRADFEVQVFAKIKRKKTQRKAAAYAMLSIAVFAFIYIGQALLFHQDPGEKIILGQHMQHMTDGQDVQDVQIENMNNVKEEVPVMENVVFASYDQQNNYAVERVAYNEHENTI